MPLVPLKHIERWYQTDHPIYRQFAYIYQNPLWNRRIPRGMPVCPYFWLAIFSMFLLRPFVWTCLAVRWFVKKAKLGRIVSWTDRIALRLLGFRDDIDGYIVGGPTFLVISISIIGSCLLYGLFIIFRAFYEAGCLTPIHSLFVYTLSIVGAATISENLWDIKRRYVVRFLCFGVPIILVLLQSILAPETTNSAIDGIVAVFLGIVSLFKMFPDSDIWWGICWLASLVYNFLGEIGFQIWQMGCGVVESWKVYLSGLVVWGFICYITFKYTKSEALMRSYYHDISMRKTREFILQLVSRPIAKIMYQDYYAFSPSEREWREIIKTSNAAWNIISEMVDSKAWEKVNEENIRISISQDRLSQIAKAVFEEWYARLVEKSKKRTQNKIRKYLIAFEDYAKHTYLAYWLTCVGKFLKWTWKNIIVVVFKNVMSMLCILWEWLKSYKTKQCPYLVFNDPKNNPNV